MFINSDKVELLKLSVQSKSHALLHSVRIKMNADETNMEQKPNRKLAVSELSFSDLKEFDLFFDSLLAYRYALSIRYLGGE